MFWYEKLGAENLSEGMSIDTPAGRFTMIKNILRGRDADVSQTQKQTEETFGYKWGKRDTYESEAVKEKVRAWALERYLDGKEENIKKYIGDKGTKILDAGCGSGVSALIFLRNYLENNYYLGADISSAVDVARERFREVGAKGEFIQCNLMELPFSEPCFDIIFSEGVLHHTDSTEESFRYLTKLLLPNGCIMFYVYRKKSIIREFTDDYIRNLLKEMDNETAWEVLKSLTKLGKALGDLNCKINIEEDIPLLGIKAGEMDLQRFFYWNICKAYYQKEFTIEEMNHVNFDWFRPLNCHRHTEEEIRSWCESERLKIERMNIQDAGITVIARK